MDALRNWAPYYEGNPESSLDRFLGHSRWREMLRTSGKDRQAQALRETYQEQLGTLGYRYFEFERVRNSKDRDIYILLYASKNEFGAKIWREISRIDEGGQRGLPFQ